MSSRALSPEIAAIATAYLDAFHAAQTADYGCCAIDHTFTIERSRRQLQLRLSNTIAALSRRLIAGMRRVIPPSWQIDVRIERGPDEWATLCDESTSLWRECRPTNLATQYVRGDGPVRVLARAHGMTLVRGLDGTIGWTSNALTTPPSHIDRAESIPRHSRDWSAMIRSYLGVPYEPGGTTGEAIDCTGLTQRLLRDMAGVVIPRHTTDQLAFFAGSGNDRPLRTGDLVFIQYDDLVWHVGFAVESRDRAWSVIHASSLAGRVIEHGLGDYLRPAIRTHIAHIGR